VSEYFPADFADYRRFKISVQFCVNQRDQREILN